MADFDSVLKGYRELVAKIRSYQEAVGLIYWDMRTGLPKKGVESRSQVVGVLSGEMFKLTVSDEMGGYLDALENPE